MLFLFVNEPCGSKMKRMTSRSFGGDVWTCRNWQIKHGLHWPASLTEAGILKRLIALNVEHAADEKRSVIH